MHGFQEMWLPIWGNLQSKSDISRPNQNMVLCKRLIRNEKHCWTLISISRATRVSQPAESRYRKEKGLFWNTWSDWLFWNKISTIESMLLSFLKNISAHNLWIKRFDLATCFTNLPGSLRLDENFTIKKHINTCTCTTLSQNFHSLLKFSMVYNFYDKWLKIRPEDINFGGGHGISQMFT